MKPLSPRAAFAIAAASLALSLQATAAPVTFGTTLSGANESPPNASTAFGAAQVTLDDALFSVQVHVDFSGLAAPASAAHIHCCTAVPGSGNVAVFLGLTGFPAATSGTYDRLFTLSSTNFATLLTGIEEGRAYVNLHHAPRFGAGEIRGFLVPEPGTLTLALGALALVGATKKRHSA